MRTAPKLLLPLLVGLAIGTGCSLIVNFDPENQPCDLDQQCLEGYGCVAGKCQKGAPPVAKSPCGDCAAGFKCLESSRQCVPNTCQYTRCVVGSICDESTGAPFCRPVQAPAIGHSCKVDADCTAGGTPNRYCLHGAVQNDDQQGSLRTGICVERCPSFGGSCLTTGATCRDFPMAVDGGSTRLCVPDNLLVQCKNDLDCLDPAFVCTLFDNPNLGPLMLCDQALGTGAQPSLPCSSSKSDGGTLPYCANGLCLPQNTIAAVQPVCGVPCSETTCGTGQTCALSEFTLDTTPRHIPVCVPSKSFCQTCADNSNCNADAPRCTPYNFQLRCLAACSVNAGEGRPCPLGTNCAQLDAGFRCVPATSVCP